VLRPHTYVGDNTTLGHHVVCEGKTWIGNNVLVHAQSHLTLGMIVEDWVFMGPCSVAINDKDMLHGRRHVKKFVPQGPYIKFGARIGSNAVIQPGVTVGRECLVGSSAVVTKDLPDYSVALGVPAKVVKQVPEEWRLSEELYEEFRKRVSEDELKQFIRNLISDYR